MKHITAVFGELRHDRKKAIITIVPTVAVVAALVAGVTLSGSSGHPAGSALAGPSVGSSNSSTATDAPGGLNSGSLSTGINDHLTATAKPGTSGSTGKAAGGNGVGATSNPGGTGTGKASNRGTGGGNTGPGGGATDPTSSDPTSSDPTHTSPTTPAPPTSTSPKPTPTPTHTTTPPQSGTAAQDIINDINAARAKKGLSKLHEDSRLDASSHEHNLVMAEHNSLTHQYPGEDPYYQRIANEGVSAQSSGECVGSEYNTNYDGVPESQDMFNEMMAEGPPATVYDTNHYSTIMNSKFTDVGVDVVVDDANGATWMTMDFAQE